MMDTATKNIFTFVAAFYILYVTMPLVGQSLALPPQYVPMIVTLLVVLISPKAFFNKQTVWLGFYLGVLVVYLLLEKPLTISGISEKKSNLFKLMMEMAFILPSFSIMCVYYRFQDKRLTQLLFYTAIVGLGSSFLYLFPLIIANSNILRIAMHAERYGLNPFFGAPRYSLMHAYVIIASPALLACLLHKNKSKKFFVCFFIMLSYMIFRSYITTSILLFIGILVAAFLRGSDSSSQLAIRGVLSAIVFVVFAAVGGLNILYDSSYGFFEGSYAQGKMDQLGAVLAGNTLEENSLNERIALHMISVRSFIENPLVGYPKIGGHSNMLDRLGGMGILCFFPYLMFLISIFKRCSHSLKNSPRTHFYYCLGVAVVFILLYEKGLFSYEGWAFYAVILPASAFYLSMKENSKLS